MPAIIKILEASHAQAWWELRLEALEREPQAFGGSAEEHRKFPVDRVAERLRASSAYNFVMGAFAGERLVGTAGFERERHPKKQHKGVIWGCYVTAEERGRGSGRALLKATLEHMRSEPGLERVNITVVAEQQPAVKLYESLGFRTWGTEKRALNIAGRYVDELYMVLKL